MSGSEPQKWSDKIVSVGISIFVAALAIYCAVSLIQAILPTLLMILGIAALIGLTVGVIVVIRTLKERW
ncbi:hypothetical protein [Nocardia sp. BMG111209]|uniref:hypothetical protein n=1 Tax=Nocardia sp. BMG111209 TaxID=1160137 RepID=UPI0003A2C751|nr:hypothetical protein [Nocardia sp. BMG111209]